MIAWTVIHYRIGLDGEAGKVTIANPASNER